MRPILAMPLLAIAALIGAVPATSATYHFRGKASVIAPEAATPAPGPSVSEPDPFHFLGLTDAAPNSTHASERVELTGHSALTVRISGEASAEFRVCLDRTCMKGTSWGSASVDIPAASERRSFVEMRMASGPAAGPARSATLMVGRSTATWSVTPRESAVETTTAGLPSGWALEYVPQSITVSNPQALDGLATSPPSASGSMRNESAA